MPKTKTDKQLFTVGRVFFLLIVIPLSLVAFLIANGIYKVGESARTTTMTVLDKKCQEEIKARALSIADEVTDFLRERQRDLLIASILPATEETYKEFVQGNRKSLWVKQQGGVQQLLVPLYVEMAFVGRTGDELIKISQGEVVPKSRLLNVANPANTLYYSDYFAKTKALNKGEIYVSPVLGWYVSKERFQKGDRFNGIVRFATPIYDKQGFAGIVTLALDYRHLARFTDNIIPTQSAYVIEADATTGDYAFMVDNRGFVISHPNDYHIAGLNTDGTPVPPLTKDNEVALMQKGMEVLNFYEMGYINPTLPKIAKDAAQGKAGMMTYQFGGRTQFIAYAPIKFFCSTYPEPAGFGWVGMNVDMVKFSEIASATSQKIQREAKSWVTTIIVIIALSVVLLFFIVAILARGISRSIAAEVPAGSEQETLFPDEEEEEER